MRFLVALVLLVVGAIALFLFKIFTFEPAHAHGGNDTTVLCERYLSKGEAPFPDLSADNWSVVARREREGSPTVTFYRDTMRPELPVAAIVAAGSRVDLVGATIKHTRVTWWYTYPNGRAVVRTARREVEEMVCERPYNGIPPRIDQ